MASPGVSALVVGEYALPLRPSEYVRRNIRHLADAGAARVTGRDAHGAGARGRRVLVRLPALRGQSGPASSTTTRSSRRSTTHARTAFLGGNIAESYARMGDPLMDHRCRNRSTMQDLVARWWLNYDEGNFDVLAELLTEDAHFTCRTDTGTTDYEEFVRSDLPGRAEVMAWQTDHRINSPYPLRHNAANVHVVEDRGDEATFASVHLRHADRRGRLAALHGDRHRNSAVRAR